MLARRPPSCAVQVQVVTNLSPSGDKPSPEGDRLAISTFPSGQ
jgi:hypothetical protein